MSRRAKGHSMDCIVEDTSFPYLYDYTPLRERPGMPVPTYYYPGAHTEGGRDGVLVRFAPPGRTPWIGIFAFGDPPAGKSGIYTHPDEHCLCIVARGHGYLIRDADPTRCEEVAVEPILDVRPIPARGLLISADFIRLVAYDRSGIAWHTGRLVLDDLHITSITSDYILGTGYAGYDEETGYDLSVTKIRGEGHGR